MLAVFLVDFIKFFLITGTLSLFFGPWHNPADWFLYFSCIQAGEEGGGSSRSHQQSHWQAGKYIMLTYFEILTIKQCRRTGTVGTLPFCVFDFLHLTFFFIHILQ
jgi:hypothetical protein